MLGEALIDPYGIDGNAPGLGLLPLVTVFALNKTVQHTQTRFAQDIKAPFMPAGAPPQNPWAALAGVEVSGYEIHHGQTAQHPAMAQAGDVAREVLPTGLGWQNAQGNVLGLYLHGLLEDPNALQALFGAHLSGPVPTLDAVFDGLAHFIEQHFEPGFLQSLVTKASPTHT
jgi:adenosylcobyric acid synthase